MHSTRCALFLPVSLSMSPCLSFRACTGGARARAGVEARGGNAECSHHRHRMLACACWQDAKRELERPKTDSAFTEKIQAFQRLQALKATAQARPG